MKKTIKTTAAVFIVILFVLSASSCGYIYSSLFHNYPGGAYCWVCDGFDMVFYFPAEAGPGNAEGMILYEEAVKDYIVLHFNTKTGFVTVEDGEGTLFTADTKTDRDNKICTFTIKSNPRSERLPDTMTFHQSDSFNAPQKFYDNPYMPENTTLEYWILQDVLYTDFSDHYINPYLIGGTEYYGKGYTPVETDGEPQAPDKYVSYTVTPWPDYASTGTKYVTAIYITDPEVKFFGLTVDSPVEEYNAVFEKLGFEFITEGNYGLGFKGMWSGKYYSVTLSRLDEKNKVMISAPVTNKTGIVY